jgi:hypothetical protein
MREKYRIGVFGEIEEVYINFFESMNILNQELIGDTWFFTIRNGKDNLTFSIHDNYWKKVQVDLRDTKIDGILE